MLFGVADGLLINTEVEKIFYPVMAYRLLIHLRHLKLIKRI